MIALELRYAAAHVLRKPKNRVTRAELTRMKRAWAYLMICEKSRSCGGVKRNWKKR